MFISPLIDSILLLIFALIIGSFLNVVIYRLPHMLFRDWREQCETFLQDPSNQSKGTTSINLFLPRSHCPHCKHPLKPWHNIPLLGYLWQRGKCAQCQHAISIRYPIVEIISAVAAICLYMAFGFSWQLLLSLLLSWGLIALTFIDLDEQLLPDQITLPLLWLGLLANTQQLFTDINSAIYGAIAGYLCLWIVAKVFYLVTKREGMGHGDFKLLAVIGAWLGWQYLLPVLLLASFAGAIIGIILLLIKKVGTRQPIPFGPFLAIAGWINLLWGPYCLHLIQWQGQ